MNIPLKISWIGKRKNHKDEFTKWFAREVVHGKTREMCLETGRILHIDADLRGARMQVVFGKVWITQEDSLDDFVLTPGEEFAVSRVGRIVVEGLQESLVRYIPAA